LYSKGIVGVLQDKLYQYVHGFEGYLMSVIGLLNVGHSKV